RRPLAETGLIPHAWGRVVACIPQLEGVGQNVFGGCMKTRPAVIVLAAGAGSRFAATGHKLTQRLGPGTVLGSTLRHAIASHLPVIVVTTEALADLARRHVASRDVVVLPAVGSPG